MMPSGYSLRDNELNEWQLFHMHITIRDKVCGVGEMYNPTYIYDLNLVIPAAADVLAYTSIRPSAGILLTT